MAEGGGGHQWGWKGCRWIELKGKIRRAAGAEMWSYSEAWQIVQKQNRTEGEIQYILLLLFMRGLFVEGTAPFSNFVPKWSCSAWIKRSENLIWGPTMHAWIVYRYFYKTDFMFLFMCEHLTSTLITTFIFAFIHLTDTFYSQQLRAASSKMWYPMHDLDVVNNSLYLLSDRTYTCWF